MLGVVAQADARLEGWLNQGLRGMVDSIAREDLGPPESKLSKITDESPVGVPAATTLKAWNKHLSLCRGRDVREDQSVADALYLEVLVSGYLDEGVEVRRVAVLSQVTQR